MGFAQDLRELLTCMSLVATVGYVTELQLYAGVCVGMQWISAIYGIPNMTERFFDLTGSTTYATVSMLAYQYSESTSWRDALLTAFVWLWCVRLGSFLFWRICKDGNDKRFAEIIVNPLCFLSAWNIQGLWVFLTLLAVLLSVVHGVDDPEVKPLDVIGTTLWVVEYIIEVTADYQKTKFRLDKRNKDQFIRTGLWGYSRHPNYFGEIMMWIGVFLVGAHTLPSFALQCGAAVSPTFMTLLIIFRSGIPLLEEDADQRWGKLKPYQEYKGQTSGLVPMPKRKLSEPSEIKRAKFASPIFFERTIALDKDAVSSTKLKQPEMSNRAKAVSLLIREEVKSDKRQAVADALTAKLTAKYAKQDPKFASSIASMANRLVLHSQRRVMEADIVALEAVVKKMSMKRHKLKQLDSNNGSMEDNSDGGAHAEGTRTSVSAGSVSRSPSANFKGQDEWVLLNALTLVEFESDQEREKTKLMEKKRMQKAWLDAQQKEKTKYRNTEKKMKEEAFQHQVQDISKWREQESVKLQQQHDSIIKVRRERDEQLRQQKLAAEQHEAQRKLDEATEVERVQAELKRLEADARHRRETEHARMKKLQNENTLVQNQKSRAKLLEHQEDVELMEAYARRLAKEDEERMRRLQTNLQRRDQRMGIAENLQAQMRQKALEDERRAEEYQKKKDTADILLQQQKKDARHKEALERQKFLFVQRAQKKQRERQEVEDDLTFARQYHAEGRAAIEAQQRQVQGIRQRNKSFQEKLIVQMVEQRQGQPMSPLHLPRTLMNSRERSLNAKLLQKLEDPDMGQKVLEKVSPVKEAPVITTTFY
ncbi:uncharacterized protein PITG_04006 [Phytophthora infestans T30-4]|uniref:Uncharacterized protein n=1 Tax=Phytophthora infestans (strain T30-4) TaxID=403677 RepID=D0MZ36_PHYIT|nr:uncharacterized protein PITG_04006 [Phytophthora infestans T30-4]EEY66434.1 conserved hypothetical protein [Phytophthora infestans T30-4]|eukprot:XP_002907033.1 conserved hypothetical protein [Phytophthora infestans T30-4]